VATRPSLQPPLNLSDDHLDRDCVVPSARDDHVGVPLARLDELKVHRLHARQVLLDDLVEGSPAHVGVALDTANQPYVRVGVDEHFHIT
jgi:hypothetical protein